eukprot:637349-Pyramimonas_sp.AAC.1
MVHPSDTTPQFALCPIRAHPDSTRPIRKGTTPPHLLGGGVPLARPPGDGALVVQHGQLGAHNGGRDGVHGAHVRLQGGGGAQPTGHHSRHRGRVPRPHRHVRLRAHDQQCIVSAADTNP